MTTEVPAPSVPELLASLQQQAVRLQQLQAENDWLRAQCNLAQHKQFGPSSEKTAPGTSVAADALQGELVFNEAEAQAAPTPEPDVETITSAQMGARRKKSKGKRQADLAHLPVEEVRHELPVDEQVCPQCAGALHEIGTEVRQELKIIPAQAILMKHVQVKYSCRHCALHDTSTPVVTAPMPKAAFPNSLASPSAVAYVMNQKFELGLPLYRQEQHFQDLGLNLSRQTLANWMIKGAGLLGPLYDKLHELLRQRDILHADETKVQVLHETGRAATTDSRMWVYCSGRDGPPLVLYDYQTTRGSEHPRAFLKGFTGFLHVDGYAAYDSLQGITLAGCWAHARRKFDEAIKSLPPVSRAGGTPCASRVGLDFCNKLFKVERDWHDVTPEERLAGRQLESAPILAEFRAWLDQQAPLALPKSPLGQAITYCRNQWAKLNTFMQDGRLEIDNNRCERAVKPFVIGRKNWLFANVPQGARASAIIYSIVETARAHNLRPLDYLNFLFERLPAVDSPTDLNGLLPWAERVRDTCGSTGKTT